MNKQVIINQADLDKLEEARCALFDFLEEKGLTEDVMDLVKITNITQHMWNLANKKHPVYVPVKELEVEFKPVEDLITAYICGVTEVDESWPRPDDFNEQCSLYQVVCINSSTGKINNRLKALEELGVEISNVTKADGEIMFSFDLKDLTAVCGVFKIKKKIKSKMTEEQKQIARDRLKEAREHKDLTQ